VWGVYPRLESIHAMLGDVALGLVIGVTSAFLLLFGAVSYTLVFHRPNRIGELTAQKFFAIFPLIAKVSHQFGISKDRLGYSLLEIHNEMVRTRLRKMSSGRILCLAPRCLDKENVEQIRSLTAEYDCDFYMAPTGAQARQKIVQVKPAAIIGIACERDLITGIRDVGYRLPVIGITNKRPFGPCKGAFIDLNELREAIETFKERFECVAPAHDDAPMTQVTAK